jgi:phosphonate transport system substrate-binding protein
MIWLIVLQFLQKKQEKKMGFCQDIRFRLTISLLLAMTVVSCTKKQSPLGSAENPIQFFMVPSVDAKVLDENTKILKQFLEANTPYKFRFSIPNSYIAVVEAFGTERADVASLNTYGYILAHERFGAEARITVVRWGDDTYRAQILARADGPIKTLQDLNGKRFAYVDPASTSGYHLPQRYIKNANIKLGETVFANKHDNVVMMIYQGQVDAGATFYSPPHDGKIEDARRLVKAQFPDVEKKVKILSLTDPIPNDPIIFRKNLPEEMKKTITDALINFIRKDAGRDSFHKMLGVTDFRPTTDAKYDDVRKLLKDLGQTTTKPGG